MPGGDGTGPTGFGPMSGRGAGYCAGYPFPGFMNPMQARPYGAVGPGAGAMVPYGTPSLPAYLGLAYAGAAWARGRGAGGGWGFGRGRGRRARMGWGRGGPWGGGYGW